MYNKKHLTEEHKKKIEFEKHRYMNEIEHSYQCDIFIPTHNLVIECDGDYWHNYPKGKDVDWIRSDELKEEGFKVLRLWEHEIKSMDLNRFNMMFNFEIMEKMPQW